MGLHDTGVKEFALFPSHLVDVAKAGDAKLTHRAVKTVHRVFLAMASGERDPGGAALARKYVGALRKVKALGGASGGAIQRYIDQMDAALRGEPKPAPKRHAARKARTRRGK